jgi:hypothetical protein
MGVKPPTTSATTSKDTGRCDNPRKRESHRPQATTTGAGLDANASRYIYPFRV